MQALKVRVKNGRPVKDEPTDLPDGAEVEVVVIDDKLTPDERAELHASLDRALDDSDAGRSERVVKIVLLAEAQRRFVAEYYGHDREHDVVEVHTIWGAHRERGPRL